MAWSRSIDAEVTAIKDRLEQADLCKYAGRVLRRPKNAVYESDLRENFIDEDGVLRATLITGPNARAFEDEATRRVWRLSTYTLVHMLAFNEEDRSADRFRDEMEAIHGFLSFDPVVFGVPHRPEAQRLPESADVDGEIVTTGDRILHSGAIELTLEAYTT